MMRLYKALPRSIRSKMYMAVADQVEQNEKKRVEQIETTLPHVELDEKHIQNLRVLLDRDALLRLLPRHAVVTEVGVAEGNFTKQILSITNPKELHLIDSWSDDERYQNLRASVEKRFAQEIQEGLVFIHQGYSTTELAQFKDCYFDWVYIDTAHDYLTTAKELEICQSKVKRNGIIAGHDYTIGNWLSHFRYGVIEAIHEFCIQYDWEMIYITHESHRFLSFALKQIAK